MTTPVMPYSLANVLGESDPEACAQLERITALLGPERCVRLVQQTLSIQQLGGLLAPDGARPRTAGGVFFWLVRGSITYAERATIFPAAQRKERDPPLGAPETLEWWHENDSYTKVVRTLLAEPGTLTTMKMTLIGRPQGLSIRTSTVLFVLEGTKPPTLPKGVPPPQGSPPRAMVLVGRKQWDRVATALDDPEDSLIIEGYPTLDPRFGGITVHATKVTSKVLSAQQRAEQRSPVASNAH